MKEQEILQACDRIATAFDNEGYTGGKPDKKFNTMLDGEVKTTPMKVAIFYYPKGDTANKLEIIVVSDPTPKSYVGNEVTLRRLTATASFIGNSPNRKTAK